MVPRSGCYDVPSSVMRHFQILRNLLTIRSSEKVRKGERCREGSIHFTMGRVLKRMKRTEAAMRAFSTALNLDPNKNTLIKSDRLDEPEINEDVSAF